MESPAPKSTAQSVFVHCPYAFETVASACTSSSLPPISPNNIIGPIAGQHPALEAAVHHPHDDHILGMACSPHVAHLVPFCPSFGLPVPYRGGNQVQWDVCLPLSPYTSETISCAEMRGYVPGHHHHHTIIEEEEPSEFDDDDDDDGDVQEVVEGEDDLWNDAEAPQGVEFIGGTPILESVPHSLPFPSVPFPISSVGLPGQQQSQLRVPAQGGLWQPCPTVDYKHSAVLLELKTKLEIELGLVATGGNNPPPPVSCFHSTPKAKPSPSTMNCIDASYWMKVLGLGPLSNNAGFSGFAPPPSHSRQQQQRKRPPSRKFLRTDPCVHTVSWKRLRAKRGYGYYVCQECGAKWKSPGANAIASRS